MLLFLNSQPASHCKRNDSCFNRLLSGEESQNFGADSSFQGGGEGRLLTRCTIINIPLPTNSAKGAITDVEQKGSIIGNKFACSFPGSCCGRGSCVVVVVVLRLFGEGDNWTDM